MSIESISDINDTSIQFSKESTWDIEPASYPINEKVLNILKEWESLLKRIPKTDIDSFTSRELLVKAAIELTIQQNVNNLINKSSMSELSTSKKIDLESNHKLINHIMEAAKVGMNPIELAFQKFDLELAEMLFLIREKDLSLGKPTFEHPGYDFKIRYKSGDQHYIWSKPTQCLKLNGWGADAPAVALQINIEALKLLMKYDTHKHNSNFASWQKQLNEMLVFAEFNCDLNGFLFLYPYLFDETYLSLPLQYQWRGFIRKGYLIDPVLSGIAIDMNNTRHFWHERRSPPAMFYDFRPDDTVEIREIKDKIQRLIVWTLFCACQPETNASELEKYYGHLPCKNSAFTYPFRYI